jgi:hypothetical protein
MNELVEILVQPGATEIPIVDVRVRITVEGDNQTLQFSLPTTDDDGNAWGVGVEAKKLFDAVRAQVAGSLRAAITD